MRAITQFTLPALILAMLSGLPAQASGFQDTAWVVASAPVYENVNQPRRECWTEQVGYDSVGSRDRGYGGAILGGLVGGLLGNTVGKGHGRQAATAIGAATGAIVGDNIDNDGQDYRREARRPRFEERCRVVDNISRELTGYNVTYRYQGRDYTTFMAHDPGRSVRVNVNISLADGY